MRLGIPLCLALAGCATATQPAHPLMGMWVGQKSLVLDVSTYSYGEEHGDWTGGGRTFRYKRSGSSGAPEECGFSLRGRILEISGCRLAGRYRRSE